MANFTDKTRAFVAGKATGLPNKEAAIAAGYSPGTAESTASRLMQRVDVREAIEAAKGGELENAPLIVDPSSSLDVLRQLYMNPKAPTGLRFEAAKAALPYEHGKKGEKGKKEKLQDEAKEAAGGDFTPRRRPGRPRLTAVA